MPKALEVINRILETDLFPALSALYGVEVQQIRVMDAFIVKYSAEAQVDVCACERVRVRVRVRVRAHVRVRVDARACGCVWMCKI